MNKVEEEETIFDINNGRLPVEATAHQGWLSSNECSKSWCLLNGKLCLN